MIIYYIDMTILHYDVKLALFIFCIYILFFILRSPPITSAIMEVIQIHLIYDNYIHT